MNADSKVERLAHVDLFSTCSRKELKEIARFTNTVEFAPGQTICNEGAAGGSEMFVVESGSASVTVGGRQVGTIGAGDTVGEMALLDQGPRSATVVAESPMTLFSLGPRELFTLIEDIPLIGQKILGVLARRLADVQSTIVLDEVASAPIPAGD